MAKRVAKVDVDLDAPRAEQDAALSAGVEALVGAVIGNAVVGRGGEVTRKRTRRNLAVPLTTEELLTAGRDMARASNRLGEIEEQRRAAAGHYKAEQQRAQSDHNAARNLFTSGLTFRDVECELVYDWSGGTVTVIRLDTGEVEETRPIQPGERQGNLDDTEGF